MQFKHRGAPFDTNDGSPEARKGIARRQLKAVNTIVTYCIRMCKRWFVY